ncbi:MAG TPA: YbdD/YjiX family protein [Gemmatimonadaceae bacterium]
MSERLVSAFAGIRRALRLMLGAPDYERYLEHVHAAHPGCTPMSQSEFWRERLDARYTRPGSRCC